MKFKDHLRSEKIKQIEKMVNQDKLSKQDIEELMGKHNRGMKRRKGGALGRA